MARASTVLSWNVEHFGRKKNEQLEKDPDDIIGLMNEFNLDVLGTYEVVRSGIFQTVVNKMPNYTLHITEGTQRLEYKAGNNALRLGALLTVTVDGEHYPMLFLHPKSFPAPIGFGIRDDQMERALTFRNALDNAANNGRANYIFFAGSGSNLPQSELDHVVAAKHLKFEGQDNQGTPVKVAGWVDEPTDAKKDAWVEVLGPPRAVLSSGTSLGRMPSIWPRTRVARVPPEFSRARTGSVG